MRTVSFATLGHAGASLRSPEGGRTTTALEDPANRRTLADESAVSAFLPLSQMYAERGQKTLFASTRNRALKLIDLRRGRCVSEALTL